MQTGSAAGSAPPAPWLPARRRSRSTCWWRRQFPDAPASARGTFPPPLPGRDGLWRSCDIFAGRSPTAGRRAGGQGLHNGFRSVPGDPTWEGSLPRPWGEVSFCIRGETRETQSAGSAARKERAGQEPHWRRDESFVLFYQVWPPLHLNGNLSMHALFTKFAELCQRLAETGSKLEKRALMAEYLRPLPVPEAGLAALYLAGVPFPETDGRPLNVGGAALSRVLAQLSGSGQPAMHAAYLRHGDLGGAAQDLLQVRGAAASTLSLPEVAEGFAAIADAAKPARKQQITLDLLKKATTLEAKYLIKIILGDMRTGIQVSLVEEAIAAAYSVPIGEVRRARMLNGNLPEVLELAATGRLAEARMKLFHPLGFMLASPVETVEEALQRFTAEVAEEGLAGPVIKEAQLEDKYDGVRAQIHCGAPEHPGRVALFSRSREDMTASFPEIVEAFASVDEPLVLDGEILAWKCDSSGEAGRALPFSSLQARLGRKRVTAEM